MTGRTLKIGEPVVWGLYEIASLPFGDKNSAYKEIEKYWNNEQGITAYGQYGRWYIVKPV